MQQAVPWIASANQENLLVVGKKLLQLGVTARLEIHKQSTCVLWLGTTFCKLDNTAHIANN